MMPTGVMDDRFAGLARLFLFGDEGGHQDVIVLTETLKRSTWPPFQTPRP